MRHLKRLILLASTLGVAAMSIVSVASAVEVTLEEARLVAANHVTSFLSEYGSWGGSTSASVGDSFPLERNGRLLGHAFEIEPIGYVVVSPLRELAPIRAYSDRSNLLPDDDQLTEAILVYQEIVHDGLAARLGRPVLPTDDLRSHLPMTFDEAWNALLDPGFDPGQNPEPRSSTPGMDYEEGQTLLVTSWNQTPPYNNMCPDRGCEWAGYGYCNENALVGCVATAGAQVLRYYNWPPSGQGSGYEMTYDWANMAYRYHYDGGQDAFWYETDGGTDWATQEQLDAPALVSWKVGATVSMDYGCDASSAHTYNLHSELPEHFRFSSSGNYTWRDSHSYSEWVSLIQGQFNANRPVVYRIPGHAIVGDGWDDDLGVHYFHYVYGHNGSNDGWFSIGEIPGGGSTDEHYVVYNLVPEDAVGSSPLGTYTVPAFGYRYFNRDADTIDAEFAAGHKLQVLKSGLLLEATDTGDSGLSLRFHGAPGNETTFFMYGDLAGSSRIKINDGTIKLAEGAQMAIY